MSEYPLNKGTTVYVRHAEPGWDGMYVADPFWGEGKVVEVLGQIVVVEWKRGVRRMKRRSLIVKEEIGREPMPCAGCGANTKIECSKCKHDYCNRCLKGHDACELCREGMR